MSSIERTAIHDLLPGARFQREQWLLHNEILDYSFVAHDVQFLKHHGFQQM